MAFFKFLIACGLLLACSSGQEINDLDDSKQDGFSFLRELSPKAVNLSGETLEAKFQEDRYVAYEFNLGKATDVHIASGFGWADILADALGSVLRRQLGLTVSHLLFVYDESDPTGSNEGWDLVERIEKSTAQRDLQAGNYLLVVLASPEAYQDNVSIYTEISEGVELDRVAPGALTVRAIVNDGHDASNIRIAVGAQAAVTDETGRATLRDVPAGYYEVKFGPDGLGRDEGLSSVFIVGDRIVQARSVLIDRVDYESWQESN